jgi:hypothetical protein
MTFKTRIIGIGLGIAALASTLTMVAPTPASACSYAKNPGTWPICEIGIPDLPRIHVSGPRPDLTPKESPWCNNKGKIFSDGGWSGYYLVSSTKHELNFWPDYWEYYYQAVYWNSTNQQYEWYRPNERDYPSWIQGTTVYCDA